MTSRDHALKAAELLAGVERYSSQLAELTDEQRLQAVISGGFKRANADLEWTRALAETYAVVSIALTLGTEL